jgi:hypothetical protein
MNRESRLQVGQSFNHGSVSSPAQFSWKMPIFMVDIVGGFQVPVSIFYHSWFLSCICCVYFGLICRWFDMALRASLLLETRTSSMSRYDSRCYSCMYPSFSFTYAITPRDTSCTHSPLILRLDQRFISSPSNSLPQSISSLPIRRW